MTLIKNGPLVSFEVVTDNTVQKKRIDLAIILLVTICILCGFSLPRHFKVKVVDTEGQPIPSAEVIVGWSWGGGWTEGPESDSKKGESNRYGEYTFLGLTKGTPSVSARKDGYYRTWSGEVIADPIQVHLRKQQNPTEMYAKRAKVDLPSRNGDFGYDLFIGDLVAPHGVGKSSDIIFRVSTTEKKRRDGRSIYTLHGNVIFNHEDDGLKALFVATRALPQSEYRMPFVAPTEGYKPSLHEAFSVSELPNYFSGSESEIWHWADQHSEMDRRSFSSNEVNCFIKVRSSSEKGACYGLLNGVPKFGYRGDGIPWITFTYYLNPDRSTNIEYDPKGNLMKEFRRYRLNEDKPRYP